jgi:integrase/recombinase XerD
MILVGRYSRRVGAPISAAWGSRAGGLWRFTKQEHAKHEMRQTLDAFLARLGADGATPASTLTAYRTDLIQCVTFLAERGVTDAAALRPDDLQAFCDWLRARGYANATIARRVGALRAFGAFLLQAGLAPADPCVGLRPPAVTRTLRPALTTAQIDALRELMLKNGTPDGWRDRAILEVLLATALRASDLVALDVHDVALDTATLTARGRAGKPRTAALAPPAVMALAAYLQLGRAKLLRASTAPALFLNRQGERLTRQGCWVVLKDYARRLGLDDLSPERLRQSAAAHRFADGASVEEVRALLGHAMRKTTAVYRPADAGG